MVCKVFNGALNTIFNYFIIYSFLSYILKTNMYPTGFPIYINILYFISYSLICLAYVIYMNAQLSQQKKYI